MRWFALILVASLITPAHAASVPFWGAHASVPIDTPLDELKKGDAKIPKPSAPGA